MSVFSYARVSTNSQADHGQSLGVQERMAAAYAELHGFAIDSVFVDRGVSASKPLSQRPKGGELLAAIHDGDILIATRLDRIFRNAGEALITAQSFRERGISLHLIDLGGDVTGNGIGKVIFGILSVCAEWERDQVKERIQAVKADQKARGRYLGGGVPFGYRKSEDGGLVEHKGEQEAIAYMVKLHGLGASLREIAVDIHDSFPRRGVSHQAVARILAQNGTASMS